jgi:hypothetical protein
MHGQRTAWSRRFGDFISPLRGDLSILHVEGDSMAPTLVPGDLAICLRVRDPRDLAVGDVVVFQVPDPKRGLTIKRLAEIVVDARSGANEVSTETVTRICLVRSDNPRVDALANPDPIPIDWITARIIWHPHRTTIRKTPR